MFFDPLVSWIVPVFGYLFDKMDSLTTTVPKHLQKPSYPEPHRDPKTGSIIIENSLLWNEDIKKYGYAQAHKWVSQGRYNLTPEELKKEKERIKKELEELYKIK